MKRQHSSDETEDERPAKSGRSDDQQQQQLDLNSTPRGFDLNAPLPEEDEVWSEEVSVHLQPDPVQKEVFSQRPEPAAELGIDEDLDLLHAVWNAWSQQNAQQVDEILVTICEEIVKFPTCLPKYQYLTCFYVARKLPEAFCLPKVFKLLLSFLDGNGSQAAAAAMKKQNFLPAISCRLLYRAFSEKTSWPLEFVKVYLEDATNARVWVDNELCKEFVANILTAFREDNQDIGLGVEDAQASSEKADATTCNQQAAMTVKNRYTSSEDRQNAKTELVQALSQLIRAPSSKDNPRILFRLFTLGMCYDEVRVSASNMLEVWLNNPVHFRGAKMLLDRILQHTHGTTSSDYATVENLLSLRLNNQAVSQAKSSANNLYADIVFQVVQKRSEYILVALKNFITSEMNSKVSQNMKGILAVLKALPDSLSPERELALAIKDLALTEDSGTRLQDAVARLTKHLNRDVSPSLLSRAIFEPWQPIEDQNESMRLSWLKQITGLACRLLIQSAAPFALDEKFICAISTGEPFQNETFNDYFTDFSTKVIKFQVEALTWCTDVLNVHLPSKDAKHFPALVRMLMFLESPEEYHSSSMSADNDLNCFQLAAYSMHASEEILARVILMGISNQYPMLQEDALDIVEKLVWRATASKKHMFGTLNADSVQLPAAVVKLSSFSVPNVSRQLSPQIVLKDMYWKSCLLVLTLAVFNPSGIGKNVWETFPAIKLLMECLITEKTHLSLSEEDRAAEAFQTDLQAEEAVDAFLQKEISTNSDLGAFALNGQWKGNVMFQNNRRKPPTHVLEELGEIDKIHSLGRLLRACRSPNFVHDMVRSQDFKQAWAWIKKVMSNEPEIVGMLPYDWQCKLLYIHERSALQDNSMSMLTRDVQGNLGKLFTEDDGASEVEVKAVVEFLSRKLESKNSDVRSCGRRCFSGILGRASASAAMDIDKTDSSSDTCSSWLEAIEKLKLSKAVLTVVVPSLQEALKNESSVNVIYSYLAFLEKHLPVTSLALAVARLLVDRKFLAQSLLLDSTDIFSRSIDSTPCTDIILSCFTKVCAQTTTGWDASLVPLLKLVSPQTDAAVRVHLPSVVLEAMIEVLIITSESEGCRTKDAYRKIFKLLFPGFLNDDCDTLIAYTESQTGQRLSILSEDQAIQLAKSKDMKLARAGLSKLDTFKKVDLLQKLGLSTEAKSQILKELAALPDSSAAGLLLPLPEWQRLFLLGCFSEAVQPGASPIISRLSELKRSSKEDSCVALMDEKPIVQAPQERMTDDTVKSTLQNLFEMKELDGQNYVSVRNLFQQSAVSASDSILEWMQSTFTQMSVTSGGALLNSASLVFPVLTLLRKVASEIVPKKVLASTRSGVPQNCSILFSACSEKIRQLEKALAETLGDETTAMQDCEVRDALTFVPRQLEKLIRETLVQRFNGCLGTDESSFQPFLPLVQQFMDRELQTDTQSNARIEMAGRYALLFGILSHLDPSLSWCYERNVENSTRSFLCMFIVLHYVAQSFTPGSMKAFGDILWADIIKAFKVAENKQLDGIPLDLAAPVVLEFLSACWINKAGASSQKLASESAPWTDTLASFSVASCSASSSYEQRLSASLKVLLDASSNPHVLAGLIRHLNSLESKNAERCAAKDLIFGFYAAHPVTVGRILTKTPSFRNISFMSSKIKNSNGYHITRRAIGSVFANSSNLMTYGFCYYMAANHPIFMILHISTLRLYLQDKVVTIKETNGEHKNSLVNLLVFTLEMLDAVRPCLLHHESFSSTPSQVHADLESLILLYFQILGDPFFDKLPFGKFASPLAEFLSHCVAAGGMFSDMVHTHRQHAQSAFQKFGQARKISSLLHRLRVAPAPTSTDVDDSAMEKISLVKKQLVAFTSTDIAGVSNESWDMTTLQNVEPQYDSVENLLSTLTDLESASVHLPGILADMQHTLIALLKMDEPRTSDKAFRLLQRLLKYSSRNAGSTVATALLEQLGSNKSASVEVASRHVLPLFHHCEELQEHILMELFRGGKAVTGSFLQLITESLAMIGP